MSNRPLEIAPLLRRRLRRGALVVCAIAVFWAIGVRLTGGFLIDTGPVYLSSRNPRMSSIIAIVSGAIAWALALSGQRTRGLAEDIERLTRYSFPPRLAGVSAGFLAVSITILALARGAFVAGGSDSYGYVSQADLLAHGALRIDQPVMTEVTFPLSDRAWTPLAYRPAIGGPGVVPVYGPGLPLLMSFLQRVGGRDAVFLVVP